MGTRHSTTRARWDVNEIALLKYARHKDLRGKQLQALFPERTQPAINTMASAMNLFESGKCDPTTTGSILIQKALQLEQQVYGGHYGEMRDAWNEKLTRANNISYTHIVSEADPTLGLDDQVVEDPRQRFTHTVEKVKTINETNYYVIVEWLYEHDNAFDSRNEWRSAFLTFLRDQFLEKETA